MQKEIEELLADKDYIGLIDYAKEIDDVKTKNDIIIYLVFNYLSANDVIQHEFCGIDEECYKEYEREVKKVTEKAHAILKLDDVKQCYIY